jgi:hypothetical protein
MNPADQHTPATPPLPGGLQISRYTLDLLTPRLTTGQETPLRFAIKDQAGQAVTDYATAHDKDLHLIVASRDLNTFRHLHPALGPDGTWSTPVDLPAAGDYRLFADFTPAGQGAKPLTLGADLAVAGPYQPRELPPQKTTAEVDGYNVTLEGTLTAGKMTDLTLSVAKNGKPVTDLEPYLGAYGHQAGGLPAGRPPGREVYRLQFDWRCEVAPGSLTICATGRGRPHRTVSRITGTARHTRSDSDHRRQRRPPPE